MKPLDCAGCRACCLTEQIILLPEHGDDPSLYETTIVGSRIRIAPRENGGKACRYLGPQGCTIYDRRPYACRMFDCRSYMQAKLTGKNRQQRRAMVKERPWLIAIFDAAAERLRLE